MAINQPPITGDPVVDAWMLEVTRELNGGTGITSSTSVIASAPIETVDESGILRLQNRTLSNVQPVTSIQIGSTGARQTGDIVLNPAAMGGFSTINLVQNDYSLTIPDPGMPPAAVPSGYSFSMVGATIPETHMLFLGGMRLAETTTNTTRDYSISGNTVTLTRTTRDFIGLDLILTVFTASLS